MIELALLVMFLAKAGLTHIERDLLRQPCPLKHDDTE
jgi:hypothetical protein